MVGGVDGGLGGWSPFREPKHENFEKSCGYYVRFNSTCYHPPPGHTPGYLIFFFLINSMTSSRLAPEPKKKDNSAPPGLLRISTRSISVCAIKRVAVLVVVQ